MKIFFRWVLIIAFAIVIGFVGILAYLALKDHVVKPVFQLYLSGFFFLFTWVGLGIWFKKNKANQIKQPFAYSFMAAMFTTFILMYGLQYLFPTPENLQKMATSAEDEYFLLADNSLDHNRICNAAINAYNYNLKLNNEERARMFKYAILQSKCL